MALAKVQSTASAQANGTINLTFATQPILGNGIVVSVLAWNVTSAASCADNQGNGYFRIETGGGPSVAQFYCPLIVTTGTPFTVSLTGGTWKAGIAIEVSGVGTGLGIDKSSVATGTGTTPNSGSTAALTASEVFVVGNCALNTAQASITVASVSPTWNQEFESLTTANIAGETDSRILTSASGITTSISWTLSSSSGWAALVVAYKSDTPPPPASARLSQLPIETLILSDTPISARLSQLPVETLILSDAPIPARLSQLPIEVLIDTSVIPPVTTGETTQFFVIIA